MDYYLWSALVNAVTSLAVSSLVFFKNRKRKVNQLFIIFALSVGFWASCYAVWIWTMAGNDQRAALLWIRLAMVGSIVIPLAFTEFVIFLLGKEAGFKILRVGNLLFMMCALLFSFSPFFIKNVGQILIFKFWPIPGHLFYPFHAWFAANVVFSHGLLLVSLFKTKERLVWKRNFSIFLGTMIGFLGGMTNHFLWYQIPIPPIGNVFVAVYIATVGFSIVRYRFLDIEVIIKRTLVFAGLSFFVLAAFAVPFYVVTNLFGFSATGQARWWLLALIGIGITAVFRPLDRFLVKATDKYLFQKKFDFAQVLKDASRDIAWVTHLEDLTRKMLYVLIHKARTKHAAIYVRPTEHDCFELQGSEGEVKALPRSFPTESPLISYLGEYQVPITRALVDEGMSQVRNDSNRTQLMEVRTLMTDLGADVIVPSFLSGSTEMGIEDHPFLRLQGFLVLGGKKSDEDYTQQDLDVLATIAQEHTVSFEKIRLFDVYLKERELKLKAEKTAEGVNYTRTLKHETGNKLVGIESAAANFWSESSMWIDLLRKQIKSGRVEDAVKLSDKVEEIVKKYANDIGNAGKRVRLIIDSVVAGLSGDQAPKQIMDFRVPWETAKRNVKVDYDFRFDVKTEDLFKLYGIVHSIEQVFENFFTNSRDALANKEEKLIYLRGDYRDLEGHQVTWLEYWDAGPGVAEELFEKVFEQGFSTKPKPKAPTSMESGHGHGLYVCRRIVENHGGKIWLEKRPEGGSKFVFWMPFFEGRESIS